MTGGTMLSEPTAEADLDADVVAEGSTWLTVREMFLLLILASIQFTHIVDFIIIMPLGTVLGRELGLDSFEFGTIVSSYTISAGLAGALAARYLDLFDRRWTLIVLYAGFVLGTLSCGVAPNYALLLVARSVAGAFGGVVNSVVLAIVGDAFPYVRRGTAMGVIMSSFAIAAIVGIPMGLELAEAFGWQSAFFVLGALSASVLILACFTLPPLRGHLSDKEAGISGPVSAWAVLTDPNHVRAFTLTSVLVLSTFVMSPFLPTFLEMNVGLKHGDLKYMYIYGGLATLATMTWFGRLSDRFGKLLMFRLLAASAMLPMMALPLLPAGTKLPMVLIATTLFLVTTSARWVPAMALITASSAPSYRGSFLSFNNSLQQISAGIATSLAGYILGGEEGKPLHGYPAVGVIACVATIVSLFLAGRLHKDPGGDLAPDSTAVSGELM